MKIKEAYEKFINSEHMSDKMRNQLIDIAVKYYRKHKDEGYTPEDGLVDALDMFDSNSICIDFNKEDYNAILNDIFEKASGRDINPNGIFHNSNFIDALWHSQDILSDIENMCSTKYSPLDVMSDEEFEQTLKQIKQVESLVNSIYNNVKEFSKYLK